MTVVDDVKGRLDIVEVVSQHVALSRSGKSYKANCPFHQEKTPSFFVFPDRQSWRCYGACATGGDVFSFVMRSQGLEFGEVLQQLAQQTGVALPTRQKREGQESANGINETALVYFRGLLDSTQGAAAREYLEERGITRESIERFELGLSPASGHALKDHLTARGFTVQQGVQAGVLRENDKGWSGDLFRSRFMIPIRDAAGALAGFGARSMDGSQPKYLNSPRSPVFDKSRILYGLHLAKEAAREKGLVIVEGYMDAIMAHQNGFDNVAASMGTALTQEQVSQVRRLTSKVVMALDPDNAGQQATLRSLESSWNVWQATMAGRSRATTLFQKQDMPEITIAILPVGEDPDQVIRRSADEWARLTESGQPLFDYILEGLSNQLDLSTPQGKTQLAEGTMPLIWASPPMQQDQHFQALADRLGVTQETLRASVGRPANSRNAARSTAQRRNAPRVSDNPSATASAFAKMDRDPIEDYCLALLLQHMELGEDMSGLRAEHFRRHENREIFTRLTQAVIGDSADTVETVDSGARTPAEQVPSTPATKTLEALRRDLDEELVAQLDFLLQKSLPPLDPTKRNAAFQQTLGRLEERYLKELKAEEGLIFAESPPQLEENSHQQVLDINQRIRENHSARQSGFDRLSAVRR